MPRFFIRTMISLVLFLMGCGPDGDIPVGYPAFTMNPINADLGGTRIGSVGRKQIFEIENAGTGGAEIGSVVLAQDGPPQFEIIAEECAFAFLAPGEVCEVTVRHRPTDAGQAEAALRVGAERNEDIAARITGRGIGPLEVVAAKEELLFGQTPVGERSTLGAQIVLTGAAPEDDELVVRLTGDSPEEFEVVEDKCDGRFPVRLSECQVVIAFAPQMAGEHEAKLKVGNECATTTVDLTGTALVPATLVLADAAIDFGLVTAGETSPARTTVVTNHGEVPSSPITQIGFIGNDAAMFRVVAEDCIGGPLPPDGDCTVETVYQPTEAGTHETLLTFETPYGDLAQRLSGVAER